MLDNITPLIITFNEAPNIGRILAKLTWARRIVVIDSGSTDGTIDILRGCPQVEILTRPFTDFAGQCNFGLRQIDTQWVLSLDADYELSDELISELRSLLLDNEVTGYRANFVYRIWGQPLRGTLYPPRIVLYRREKAYYCNEGHGHRVVVDGKIVDLNGVVYHDDRKPLTRWIWSQQRYARQEADYLLGSGNKLRLTERIRALGWPAPIFVFFYTLFAKGCILDGWAGWHYALQRLAFEVLTALELTDRRIRAKAVELEELDSSGSVLKPTRRSDQVNRKPLTAPLSKGRLVDRKHLHEIQVRQGSVESNNEWHEK
jgi:glycosyltransferase involved in cell wall biosynthesis